MARTNTDTGSGTVIGAGVAPQIAYWDAMGNLTGDARLTWDSAAATLDLFDLGGNGTLRISPSTGFFAIGNWSGGSNGSAWIVDESVPTIYGQSGSGKRFAYDGALGTYGVGDLDGMGNYMGLFINDTNSTVLLGNNGNAGIGATGNLTKIVIDDANQRIDAYTRFGFAAIGVFHIVGSNAAFGQLAGDALTTGFDNSIFGHRAGEGLSTGNRNALFGDLAGSEMISGSNNVAFGNRALQKCSSASNNLAIGQDAGFLVNGDGNLFIGGGAGYAWISSTNQMAIGNGSFQGDTVTPANNTGTLNFVVGASAGNTIRSGNRNTILGNTADVSAAGTSDGIAIGYGAVAASNELIFGSAASPVYHAVIGDHTSAQNGTILDVDDTAQLVSVTKPFGLQGYTVATLPLGTTGAIAYVTDAAAPAYLTTVVGGGAVVTPVFYDGANWVAI